VLSKTRRLSTASLELFAEGGYRATAFAAIAESAGVTVQTVYAALGSEMGIIKALLAEMEGDAQAPVWRERTAAADEPAAKLRAFAGWTTLPTTRQGLGCLLAPMETKDNLCPGRDRRHDACGDSVR